MNLDVYDTSSSGGQAHEAGRRPYLGVLFECCGIYARVYRQPDDAAYSGRCPKCLRVLRVRVGPGGVDARFLRAQ